MKKEFIIRILTKYGTGVITKKASSFKDAYLKLSKTDRLKAIYIEDEDGETTTVDELLGLELEA